MNQREPLSSRTHQSTSLRAGDATIAEDGAIHRQSVSHSSVEINEYTRSGPRRLISAVGAIGLTIVAIGTSLPELVATLAAALKGKNDVAFGNIVGSNIYNIFGIVGLTALVKPITVPPEVSLVDWGVMCLSAVLLLLFATIGRRVTRLEAACLVAFYAAYIAHLLGVLAW